MEPFAELPQYFQFAELLLSIPRALTFNFPSVYFQISILLKLNMYQRFARNRIQDALIDTRVVLIAGPRQAGKTTLARDIAAKDMPHFSLDDASVLSAAVNDPVGFVRGLERVVIDEIQRAPKLLLAIKSEVDQNPQPGRFLLTGSANLMTIPTVADSLAGRMEVIKLLPLSRSEIAGVQSNFLDDAFAGKSPQAHTIVVGDDLIEAVLSGGYPEAISRLKWNRKQDWHHEYIDAIVQRDVREVAQIERFFIMPKLLNVLAQHSGQLVNYTSIGASLDLNHVTTAKYLNVLESLYLVQSVQPWFTNQLKRLTKSPKLHFLDAGLLSSLCGITPDTLMRDKTRFGAILETFVFSELQKISTWSEQRYRFSHFRDHYKNEVDIVVENARGDVIGIEIKSSATVNEGDFTGLKKLQAACGDRFIHGYVLYDHAQSVPFAEKLSAAPLSCLW